MNVFRKFKDITKWDDLTLPGRVIVLGGVFLGLVLVFAILSAVFG